jgi:hypothetical protein
MPDEDAEAYYRNRKSKLHQELICFRKRRASSLPKNSKRLKNFKILNGKLKKMTMGKFVIYNVKFKKKKGKYIGRKIKTTTNFDCNKSITHKKIKTTTNFDINKSITHKKRRNSKRKFSTMNISKKYRTCKKK